MINNKMTKKSSPKDFDTLAEICNPTANAKVTGVITSLSPIKKSKGNISYFDREISDGKASIRLFGFDSSVNRKLDEVDGPVTLSHCEVKRSRIGQNMEILLNSTTQIQQAEVTINTELNVPQDIDISNIYKTVDFQKVSCTAKVLNTDEPVQVSGGKTKQDITISDSSGCIRLTVWEEYINKLEEDTSYHFSGVTVRTFKGKIFLSSSKDSFTFKKIDDIGNVEYPEDPSSNISISIHKI